jgi:hypothetical protein
VNGVELECVEVVRLDDLGELGRPQRATLLGGFEQRPQVLELEQLVDLGDHSRPRLVLPAVPSRNPNGAPAGRLAKELEPDPVEPDCDEGGEGAITSSVSPTGSATSSPSSPRLQNERGAFERVAASTAGRLRPLLARAREENLDPSRPADIQAEVDGEETT